MTKQKKGVAIILERFKDVLADDPVDDETEYGDGYWFYLRPGFINNTDGIHFVHEYTIAACYGRLSTAIKPCDCKDCKKARHE